MFLYQLFFWGMVVRTSFGCEKDDPCFQDYIDAHCIKKDIIYDGTEIESVGAVSIEQCHEMCLGHPDCDHASFSYKDDGCLLKSDKVTLQVQPGHYVIPKTCIPRCTMDTIDFALMDLGGVSNVSSLMDCHALCLDKPDCFGVVWAKPFENDIYAKTCWFKNAFRVDSTRTMYFGVSMPRYCLHGREQPNGWYLFQGSYYKFIAQSNTYGTGMGTCEALGGQLASLESQEELMFARTIAFTLNFHQPDEFSGDYRIGLYGNGSQWTWSNGNIMDSNLINLWCPNEPRSTDSLSYVQLWGGAGFCADVIQNNTKPQNLICEASVCTMDPPMLNNAKRKIRPIGILNHK